MVNNQKGMALIEVIGALLVLSLGMIGIYQAQDRVVNDLKVDVAAMHLTSVADAARQYVENNRAAVAAASSPGTPLLIPISTLIGGGNLPAGFPLKNNYGQSVCVVVLKPGGDDVLLPLVITDGGTQVPDLELADMVARIGALGGGNYASDNTVIRGAAGQWSIARSPFAAANSSGMLCDGVTAGTPALAAGHAVIATWLAPDEKSKYLKSDATRMDKTAMTTPLALNFVVTVGDACTAAQRHSVARTAAFSPAVCDGTQWKSLGGASQYWREPVNTIADLGTCDSSRYFEARMVLTPSVQSRPIMKVCSALGWQSIGPDDSGGLDPSQPKLYANAWNLKKVTPGTNCNADGLGTVAQAEDTYEFAGCVGGVWTRSSARDYVAGYYTFKIAGYAKPTYIGVGQLDSTTHQFTGELFAAPSVGTLYEAWPDDPAQSPGGIPFVCGYGQAVPMTASTAADIWFATNCAYNPANGGRSRAYVRNLVVTP